MFKKWIALLISSSLVLAACHGPVYNQAENNVADVKIKAANMRKKSDNDAKTPSPLVVKPGMYVDTTPISLEKEPSWLRNRIVIRGDQLPFSYYSRTIGNGAGTHILTKYQADLNPAQAVSLSYTGTVKGALDLLASKTGYVYTVRNNSIFWQAFVTKTFDIAFMPGSSDYMVGKASGGSSGSGGASGGGGQVQNYVSSDSSDAEYSNLSGKLSIWSDLEATLKQLVSPQGKITVSQATTTVVVRDKPSNVQLIGQYIANLNNKLSKQVLVKIQVLEVNLQNDYNFGLNWQIIANAFHNSPFVFNGNYGTPLSITSLTPQPGTQTTPQFGFQGNGKTPSYTILVNALNQQGKTSVVSEPRVVCLNNQVSVIRIVKQEGYVASVQNTTLSSGGTAPTSTVTSQVTPGTVITGLTLYILPKIMSNKVYLQVNADMSVNNGFQTFGTANSSASSSIQLPNITEKHFNQRSMIRSGDMLILSGFRQVSNQANANQVLTSQALGGKAAAQENSETIVLITPIILDGAA